MLNVLEVSSFRGTDRFVLVGISQHFLRDVCPSEGHLVPLVYPEGMMFPSIFWKDTINSLLISAIPSSLLTDSWQCRKHGFASVMEHLRSRIKNPS
jgi:hypothetical protein